MYSKQNLNIWLSYVSYPVTTAVYFERALRKSHNVTTIGPKLPDELIKGWQLENMKLPIKMQDIPTGFEPDLAQLAAGVPKENYPDLFLWVESVHGLFPQNINTLGVPTACYLIDSHLSLEWHVKWALNFDYVFIAQKEYIPAFKKAGNKNVYWLPLGCDPEIHNPGSMPKLYDVGFVGSVNDPNSRRYKLLKTIEEKFRLSYKRCFWKEMAEFFASSKIVYNNAIKNDLNMRVFEVLSSGSFLLTDMTYGNGQAEMFFDDEDLGIYSDDIILEKVEYYLRNEALREKIAARGQQIAHRAHTYKHRVDEIINVAVNGAADTPSPDEWRQRSVETEKTIVPVAKTFEENAPEEGAGISRSFVIPVLDMSPASPYNILTLLDDLEEIEGDVIVIFNSIEIADKLKAHPRIDYSAIMSHNVGVSRAWNIGLNISDADVTFILNSDLHIEKETVEILERNLLELEDAAIAGPQGSFFDFNSCRDILYFDKGAFGKPVPVDGVSGFLFAVRTDYFNTGIIKFDNRYTPCYFEEWDIGLQCKLAGLKTYVVPATGYMHEWSGSIKALASIKYLNYEETREEIHARNTTLFKEKWLTMIANGVIDGKFLESLWTGYAGDVAHKLEEEGMSEKAGEVYRLILSKFPNNIPALMKLGFINSAKGDYEKALEYFNHVSALDPEFEAPAAEAGFILNAERAPRKDEKIVIEKNAVSGIDLSRLLELTDSDENRKYINLPSGEHYKFLTYMSRRLNNALIFDIGTNYGGSALALADNKSNKVVSYDVVSMSRIKGAPANIELKIGNALADKRLLRADVILLDTMHDGVFENEAYKFLTDNNYRGILILDDIHLNGAMENFWSGIKERKIDLTDIGHLTGTGIVDFSSRIIIS
jgi:tetratricopeptide (TPR) repeat protein